MKLDLFFRERRLTVLFIVLIIVAGAASLNSLPRQEDPALSARFARVVTAFPGAEAPRVEALVTEKLEQALQEIADIKRISSRSQTGLSIINLALDDHIYRVDDIWSEVRSKINDVRPRLPAQAGEPDFRIFTTAAMTLLVAFEWELDTPPQLEIMSRLVRTLDNTLTALPGTKETEIYGEPIEEILVSVDASGLAAAGVTMSELSATISGADPRISAGRIQGDQTSLIVELGGMLDSVERIRRIPLRTGDDGFVVRIADVARVDRIAREPAETMALIDGQRGIILGIKMEENRRVDRWSDEARKRIEAFNETLPPGIAAEIIFDQSIHTDKRLMSLAENLLLGAAIVVLVLFLMMGWRSALIVSTAFPLTLLMVLPLFNALGIPLHQISLTGLIIALGLLIDNAIVSVDEYNQARRSGNSPSQAIVFTIRHLSVPLLASTFTTVLTFLPLVLMPGNAGEFVSTLGAAVILAIICSLFLSLSIVPAISGFLDTRWPRTFSGGGFWRNGLRIGWCSRVYRRALEVVLARPVLGVVVGVAIPMAGFLMSTQLVDQFFPPVNRNQFQIQLKLPTQSSLAETRRAVERARDILHAHPEVVRSHWFLGEKPPRVFYNITITEDGAPRFASAFVDTRSAEHTRDLLPRLQKEMIEALPEALVLTLPFEQGPPIDSPIEVRIYGPDVRTLARLGEEIRLVLSRTRAVTFAEGTISTGQPKLVVTVDEDAARIAGFSLADIASQLGSSLDGVTGATMMEGTEEVPVRVRMSSEERTALARVVVSSLSAPDGSAIGDANARVPLNAIARIDLEPSVATITRRNGERINTIHGYLDPFALTGTSLADFRTRLEDSGFTLPMGYRLEFGGESEGSGEARANLMSVLGPLLVLMVSALVLAFNSFRMALIIGMVAFLTIGCGLFAIWLCGYPLGFMAIIGTMGLIGISINDSIVVLAAIRADGRARSGDGQAIVNVVMAASRHIVSTTLTTIGGFMPLILWGGIFWPPLAVAVAGGMIGATILALFFVPPLYVLFHRRRGNRPAQVRETAAQPAPLDPETI